MRTEKELQEQIANLDKQLQAEQAIEQSIINELDENKENLKSIETEVEKLKIIPERQWLILREISVLEEQRNIRLKLIENKRVNKDSILNVQAEINEYDLSIAKLNAEKEVLTQLAKEITAKLPNYLKEKEEINENITNLEDKKNQSQQKISEMTKEKQALIESTSEWEDILSAKQKNNDIPQLVRRTFLNLVDNINQQKESIIQRIDDRNQLFKINSKADDEQYKIFCKEAKENMKIYENQLDDLLKRNNLTLEQLEAETNVKVDFKIKPNSSLNTLSREIKNSFNTIINKLEGKFASLKRDVQNLFESDKKSEYTKLPQENNNFFNNQTTILMKMNRANTTFPNTQVKAEKEEMAKPSSSSPRPK